jgi:antitoxin (DNA-binding transcriptional repressor) of toxin-antitoxin stability system
MGRTATVRQLRNNFPAVKKLVEQEGEVIVTDQGEPKYRLTRYVRPRAIEAPVKDYLARLRRHQPKPLTPAAARALHDDNRGSR